MPFFWKRFRENLVLFFLMGLLYTIIYHFAVMPSATYAVTISYGGALVLALFAHSYCLYSYLINVGELKPYIWVNFVAYLSYMVIYYGVYIASEFLGGIVNTVYKFFFMPYDLFAIWGLKTWLSALIVHIIYIISIAVIPFLARENIDPFEEYFTTNEEQ